MSKKSKNTLSILFAPIVALFSRQPAPPVTVARNAKAARQQIGALTTIHPPSVPSVAKSYQQPSNDGRPDIVVINVNTWQPSDGSDGGPQCPPLNRGVTLSRSLLVGLTYHPLCRQSFVEKVQIGYYAYERREEWRTCALAAAYAGVFGPTEIERPEFSYSQACWLLGQVLGYDPSKLVVEGPTGRRLPVAEEMTKLIDENLWTRRGVAAWLGSVGL